MIVGSAGDEPLHFERAADGAFESLAAVPLAYRAAEHLVRSARAGEV